MRKFFYCFFFFPIFLSAQSKEQDTTALKASLSVTGVWQAGNVQTLIFRAKSDLSYQPWEQWEFKTINSYVYQAFGGEKADEDLLTLNFLYFHPERKVYPQLLAFASSNFRREIRIRSLLGAGVTFQILNQDHYQLKLSVSSEYEQTDFNIATFNRPAYNGNTSINTVRGTVWISGKYALLDEKIVISHQSYVQPSLLRSDNFRWQADLGLELPISTYVSFKANYFHTHESIVVADQQRDDKLLTFGLTVKNF